MSSPLNDLAERKIFRWLALYLAGAWVGLQVLDFFGNHFEWSNLIVPIATILFGAGFLAVAVIAWFHGEQGRQSVPGVEVALLGIIVVLGGGGVAALVRSRSADALKDPSAGAAGAADVAISDQSVAVLPFVNMSGVAENEFFSDGITEEILNALGRIPGLHVAARTSAFAFKGKTEDPREMGRILRVAHILDGSVQRSGDRARITAKLTDARSGSLLWSKHYDPDLKDIFAVEDSISAAIAEELRTRISAASPSSASTVSVLSHDLYLKGLEKWNRRDLVSLRQARDFFARSAAADSMYASAWAGLALAYAILPEYDDNLDAAESWKLGRQAANRALHLDARSAEAHAALSQMAEYSNELKTAESEARKSIALNPSFATAHYWLCEVLYYQGRFKDALAEAELALALDPLAEVAINMRASIYGVMGRTADAIRDYDRLIALNPDGNLAPPNAFSLALATRQYDLARKYGLLKARTARDSADAVLVVEGLSNPARKQQLLETIHGRRATHGAAVDKTLILELAGDRAGAIAAANGLVGSPVDMTNIAYNLAFPAMKGLRADPRLSAAFKPRMDR